MVDLYLFYPQLNNDEQIKKARFEYMSVINQVIDNV